MFEILVIRHSRTLPHYCTFCFITPFRIDLTHRTENKNARMGKETPLMAQAGSHGSNYRQELNFHAGVDRIARIVGGFGLSSWWVSSSFLVTILIILNKQKFVN